jgi:dTDP-glucose 4,6-dehydratase
MKIKKVVVTGGYGFIGSNLINFLIKKKYFVINIDKCSYSSNKYNLKDINFKNYIFFKIDLNEQNKIYKILKKYKPHAIFNLAAETHVDRSIDSPKPFIESNINGVYSLLEAVRTYVKTQRKKIKLIHVSTDEVYGDLEGTKKRANEKFSYKPSSPYAASKAGADHLIKAYIRTYKIPAIITNCSNNYGPRQFPEKLIPKIIFNILQKHSIPIYSKGLNSREWIYVSDHCEALELLFRKGRIGENYNIGSNINLTNLQLVKLITKIVSRKFKNIKLKSKIIYVKDRPGHDLRYAIDSNKIRKNFKWKPKTKIVDGLIKTIRWYIENPNYYKKLKKNDYIKRLGLKND